MSNNATNDIDQRFFQRIQRSIGTVQAWDADPMLLAECRALIPFDVLVPEINAPQKKSEYYRDNDCYYTHNKDELLLKRLCLFFKESVMTWINSPKCNKCGKNGDNMKCTGQRGPTTREEREGGADRVEIHLCQHCQVETTFARYNSPRKLLETRQGRCGEYANLFGLYCRACGYETRYVLDTTDHVWVEVFVNNRWIMADGCEGVIDEPSMYESGWGKNLCYNIGITIDTVSDVTPRYTRKFHTDEFQKRRRTITSSEKISRSIIQKCTSLLRSGIHPPISKGRLDELIIREQIEEKLFFMCKKEGEKGGWIHKYKEGRTSGSLSWRSSRHELGSNSNRANNQKEEETIKGFHCESFFPPSPLLHSSAPTLTISVNPPLMAASDKGISSHSNIIVSDVTCSVSQDITKTISLVVVDSGCSPSDGCEDEDGVCSSYFGCILQSRVFDNWHDINDFVRTIPPKRIVILCGTTSTSACANEGHFAGDLQVLSSRLGGFKQEFLLKSNCRNTNDNNDTSGDRDSTPMLLMYIGMVGCNPSWCKCTTTEYSNGIHLTLKQDDAVAAAITSKLENKYDKFKLKTERKTMPSCISTRIPDNIMTLKDQLVASEKDKREAFFKYIEEKNNSPSLANERTKQHVGYTTKMNSPIYLIDETSYPFIRTDNGIDISIDDNGHNDTSFWNTFHFLPEVIVPKDDDGIVEKAVVENTDNEAATTRPKFQVPIDETFYNSLLGPNLLKHSQSSNNITVDTTSALQNSRLVALYFSAHWCGPCRSFSPMLIEMYLHLKKNVAPTHGLEIIFISSDRDEHSFTRYFSTMPWLSVPFTSAGRILQQQISSRFDVRGIPSLVILDSISGSIVANTSESRGQVMRGCQMGDSGIENLFMDWVSKIPSDSRDLMQMLELSCAVDENDDNKNEGSTRGAAQYSGKDDVANGIEHPYFVWENLHSPIKSKRNNEISSPLKITVDPKMRIKKIFTKLVSDDGMDPNTAAARAIQLLAAEEQEIKAKQQRTQKQAKFIDDTGPLNKSQWSCTIFTNYVSSPKYIDVATHKHTFSDFSSVGKSSCSYNTGGRKVIGVSILNHPVSGTIIGLQPYFNLSDEGLKHLSPGEIVEGEWSKSQPSQLNKDIACIAGKFNEKGLITELSLLDLFCGEKSVATAASITPSQDTFYLEIPKDFHLVGFQGVFAEDGLTSVGLICEKRNAITSDADIAIPVESIPCNNRNYLDWMASRVAEWNYASEVKGNEAVRVIVSTAEKYLDNAMKNPSTPKFRHFKFSNKVMDRITRIEGGVELICALGLSVYGTQQDFYASIPLAADLDVMHSNMTRLLDIYAV